MEIINLSALVQSAGHLHPAQFRAAAKWLTVSAGFALGVGICTVFGLLAAAGNDRSVTEDAEARYQAA